MVFENLIGLDFRKCPVVWRKAYRCFKFRIVIRATIPFNDEKLHRWQPLLALIKMAAIPI
jgi:hypothetical protein